jgi:hypothetical protein
MSRNIPLGSFDVRVAADMITAVKKSADRGSPDDVSLVFELPIFKDMHTRFVSGDSELKPLVEVRC